MRRYIPFAFALAVIPLLVGIYASFNVPPSARAGAEPPTATATLTPTVAPAMVLIPEGNENNVNASIPAANIWLCVTGACAGPGEGNLVVFVYATGIVTGDFNGDAVTDGLGAYEMSADYDNFIIYSANPIDSVFNAAPRSLYPGGADGVDDGEGQARTPANCSFSLVWYPGFFFGCVTTGVVPGPTGDFDLMRLNLIPHDDLRNDLIPANDNGIFTLLRGGNCELSDVFGHSVVGSVNGGLLPVCGNLAVTVRMLESDLNLDCAVDVIDQQMIAFRYASVFGDLLYNRYFDLEPAAQDLDIDAQDIEKVVARDGSTCQAPIQPQPPITP